MTEYRYCPLCNLPTAEVRNDKKGRPYATCVSCNSRMFLKSARALSGYERLSELSRKEAGPRLAEMLRDRDALVQQMAKARGFGAAPPQVSDPQVSSEETHADKR